MRRLIWPAVDLVFVLVFVGIGRSVHDHGFSFRGFVSTAWPFATGLVASWSMAALWRKPYESFAAGVLVCIVTVAVGMSLRVVSGQGTAFAFVLVALGFLGAAILGSRGVCHLGERIHL